jgi:hypothetical protein
VLNKLRQIWRSRLTPERRTRIRHFQVRRLPRVQDLACRLFFRDNLQALAAFYGTDKWTTHDYMGIYYRHFLPWRRRRLVLLEIGIGGYDDPWEGGGSLRMWRSFFPRSRIYGIDIADKSPHDGPRIRTFRGSQDDEAFLADVLAQTGPPDLVIDDGSHLCPHVLSSFRFLFPVLRPGGLYVIEDTQTSYWQNSGGSAVELDRPDTTIGYIKTLLDRLNYKDRPDYAPSPLDRQLAAVHVYPNLVLVEKSH